MVVAVTDVNAEKRAEGKRLQDAHESRRVIVAIQQAIMVYSPDGQPVYINPVALEYVGLPIEEARADSFHDRVVHPEDTERPREARQNALSRGAPFEYELRALKKGAQYCWNPIQYNPQKDEQGRSLKEMSDEWLVAAARDGNIDTFAALRDRHSRRILWTTYRITKNWEDADCADADLIAGS